MVNRVRLVISKKENLALGPGTRLNHSELLCSKIHSVQFSHTMVSDVW